MPASAASFRATGDARTFVDRGLPLPAATVAAAPVTAAPFPPARGGGEISVLGGSTPPEPVSSLPTTVPSSA